MTSTPPPRSALDEKFKVSYFPAESFKKPTKIETSLFNTFKEGKYWNTWRMKTLATDKVQDLAEMINPDHIPVTQDDMHIFKEKQNFMHAIFDKTLQTNRGKMYVREQERDYDSQSVHRKLNSFHTKSTNARVSASTTLICITSAKIESWKGTSEAFILYW